MELTTELLARFVGGDLEIQNKVEGYMFRGLIKSIAVENRTLKICFKWLAQAVGYPPIPTSWELTDPDKWDYELGLDIVAATEDGLGRIILNASFVGEMNVLFPPGRNLDPTKVEGLVPEN
jgi:hypothetical protein